MSAITCPKPPTLDSLQAMLDAGSRALLKASHAESLRAMYFYLGYTPLEAAMWERFNRCCHPGRKIRIKSRPVIIRMGKPAVSVRRPALWVPQ